ncbi:unnamed protein product [Phytophthora fragariaefolia]|uniref:Unnamed protein product n=1 Tax=Phytophthora fragariaefolia TaxID=1490495 RepID=A0A9W6TNS5_9STRA|nr:unnamed protein product [Phytophthora fragariaefolia]
MRIRLAELRWWRHGGPLIPGAGGGGGGAVAVDNEGAPKVEEVVVLVAGLPNPPNALLVPVDVDDAPNGLLDGAAGAPNGDGVVVLDAEGAPNGLAAPVVLPDEVPKPDEEPPKAVDVLLAAAAPSGLELPAVAVPDEPNVVLEEVPNGEDAGAVAAPPPNGEDEGAAAAPPNGEAAGLAPPPKPANPDPELPPPNVVVEVEAAPPNGDVVFEAPPPKGDEAGTEAAPPKAVVDGAPNGLAAGVAGFPNGDDAGAAVAAPLNGLAVAPPPNAELDPAPNADGAPKAVVALPPPNGFACAAPPNALLAPPPNGLAAGVAGFPNGEDAAAAAPPNGFDAAAPPPNGDAVCAAPNGLAAAALPGSGSPLNSFWAAWWFSSSATTRWRWFCCSAASACSFCEDCAQLPLALSSCFEEGRSAAIPLDKPIVLAANDGELVHFSALITTTATSGSPQWNKRDADELQLRHSPFVVDPVFGVAVKGVRLHRHVEMLQWVETSHTSTSSTPEDEDRRFDDDRERIYMYDLRWREEAIDSLAFNDPSYANPSADAWKYKSLVVKAKDLVAGEFALSDELVEQIQRRDSVHLDAANRRVMANLLDQREGEAWADQSALANVSVDEDFFYLMPALREPILGDQRVFFKVTPNYPVTVCAQQQGNKLVPFKTIAGDSLHLLEDGIMSADALFDKKTEAKVRQSSRTLLACVQFASRRNALSLGRSDLTPALFFSSNDIVEMPTPFVSGAVGCNSLIGITSASCSSARASAPRSAATMEVDSMAGQDMVINAQAIAQQAQQSADMDVDVEEDGVVRPNFPALSAQQQSGGKNDFRRVRVPAHRYTPLKNDWPNIMKPIVEHLKLQIRMNTKTRCIELKNSPHTTDAGALQKAADFVQAYMMGFEVQDAVALLRLEDLFIDTFEVNDVKMLKGDHLSRAIGRVAGQDGKTKYAVENATRTRIVLADQKIHILGSFANIKLARDAICSLIMGAPPGKVYNKMRNVASRMNERF